MKIPSYDKIRKDYQKKKRMQDEKERALIMARLAKEKYLTMLHDGLS